jgi:hypothetical protein
MTIIQLTEEQQAILDADPGTPPRVIDPRSNRQYVLLTAAQFARLQAVLDPGPLSNDERQSIIQGVWKRAHWDDPCMDDYNALDHRNSQ